MTLPTNPEFSYLKFPSDNCCWIGVAKRSDVDCNGLVVAIAVRGDSIVAKKL